jgi:glutamate synthase domain-containing protein 3
MYMPQSREEKNALARERYKANSKKQIAYSRAWNVANKERVKENGKAWCLANKERRAVSLRINQWKYKGVKSDDFKALNDHYMASTHCADCDVEFSGKFGDGLGAFRCLDHCHITGEFRDVVCTGCNLRRR